LPAIQPSVRPMCHSAPLLEYSILHHLSSDLSQQADLVRQTVSWSSAAGSSTSSTAGNSAAAEAAETHITGDEFVPTLSCSPGLFFAAVKTQLSGMTTQVLSDSCSTNSTVPHHATQQHNSALKHPRHTTAEQCSGTPHHTTTVLYINNPSTARCPQQDHSQEATWDNCPIPGQLPASQADS
jgi:hypothetical protein